VHAAVPAGALRRRLCRPGRGLRRRQRGRRRRVHGACKGAELRRRGGQPGRRSATTATSTTATRASTTCVLAKLRRRLRARRRPSRATTANADNSDECLQLQAGDLRGRLRAEGDGGLRRRQRGQQRRVPRGLRGRHVRRRLRQRRRRGLRRRQRGRRRRLQQLVREAGDLRRRGAERDETDVDCGGPLCAGCEDGEVCVGRRLRVDVLRRAGVRDAAALPGHPEQGWRRRTGCTWSTRTVRGSGRAGAVQLLRDDLQRRRLDGGVQHAREAGRRGVGGGDAGGDQQERADRRGAAELEQPGDPDRGARPRRSSPRRCSGGRRRSPAT
jgi:hypothetical protein